MKAIIIPELLLDKAFDNVLGRAQTWREVSGHKSDILLEHFKLEIERLRKDLKEAT